MPQDPSQSTTTPMSTEGHDQSFTAVDDSTEPPAVHDSDQSASVHQDSVPGAPDQVHVTLPANETSSPVHSSSGPAVVSQDPDLAHSGSDKRSWFTAFSWSSGKQTAVAKVKAEVDSAQEALHPPVHTCPISSENLPCLDSAETIKPEDPTVVMGDSSPRADRPPPADATSQFPDSASIPQPESNKVDVSSVRKEQPSSRSPPSHSPQDPLVSRTREGHIPPAAHNSAIAPFAFNFPKLAKSRPRDEAAVTPQPPASSAKPPCEVSAATQDPDDVHDANSTNVIEPTRTAFTSTVLLSECSNQSPAQPTAAPETRTNTWLTYLGWNGTRTIQTEPSPRKEQHIGADSDTSSAVPDQPTTSHPHESSQEDEITARADLISDVPERSPEDENTPSVQNADSTMVPVRPAWYTPWSWSQSSSVATTAAVPDMNSGSQQDPPEQSQTDPKTEEKRSTGDRGAPTTPDQLPQDASATESVDYRNPIQSVISTNPTGWMSFFSARAIAMKSITYEKEDGKMEVVEIDDEIVTESNFASSAPAATQPSPTQVPKPPVRAPPHTSDIPPPSPPSRKSDDKRPPMSNAATNSETVIDDTSQRQPSPAPSKKSSVKAPMLLLPPQPNLVLPTWNDTFYMLPRLAVPREPPSALSKTLQYVSGVLFSREESPSNKGKGKAKEPVYSPYNKALPRTWDVIDGGQGADPLRGCKRVVIIGVHGWFPGAVLRTLAGEPTGTSSKFVSGIVDALDSFLEEHKAKLEKVTKIPLEGEGTINRRVERLYQNLIANKEWMDDLHDADAIFIATHSQGSVVSTHLLDRLITDRHIRTSLNADASISAGEIASGAIGPVRPPQRICCLALCGIHLGPLRYLGTSSLVQPYIQYFESTAARELFEFQNTESPISRDYVRALRNVLNNGIKMVYVASLTDQVVGLYSGLFTSVSHPLILRALYIDGDAYHPSDFLSNLLVLLLRIRNAGLSDGGLLTHLSEVTAGSLNGIGHSTPYEECATYSLAVNYLFLTDSGAGAQVESVEEPFHALAERNDYEIPWALRDLIADERVAALFSDEFVALRDAFRDWHPKTSILRDVKRKLQPIQRLSSALIASHHSRL